MVVSLERLLARAAASRPARVWFSVVSCRSRRRRSVFPAVQRLALLPRPWQDDDYPTWESLEYVACEVGDQRADIDEDVRDVMAEERAVTLRTDPNPDDLDWPDLTPKRWPCVTPPMGTVQRARHRIGALHVSASVGERALDLAEMRACPRAEVTKRCRRS